MLSYVVLSIILIGVFWLGGVWQQELAESKRVKKLAQDNKVRQEQYIWDLFDKQDKLDVQMKGLERSVHKLYAEREEYLNKMEQP